MPACANRRLAELHDRNPKAHARVVRIAMKRARGNKRAAARLLRVSVRTIYRWLGDAA